jgi:hypothetical protein
MTAPLTPVTPNTTLGSPLSITPTLVDVEIDKNRAVLPKVTESSSSASLVLGKLQEILEYVTSPSLCGTYYQTR